MFCPNCGIKNDDSAKYCAACGEKLENDDLSKKSDALKKESSPLPQIEELKFTVKKNRKKVKIAPLVLIIILIVGILALPKLIISNATEKTLVDSFIKAELSGDVETIIGIMFPEEVLDEILKEEDMDRSTFVERLDDVFQSAKDTIDQTLGSDWTYSYEIQNIKNLSSEEVKEREENYAELCDLNISEAKTVEIEITVKGEETETSKTLSVGLMKVDKKWYVDFASLEDLI